MAAQWKHFKTAMKEKRSGKRKAPHDILQKEEIIIQRLSAEVSGKAQKHSRVGPREFVPFDYDEVTLENIKNACRRHFAPVVGERMICDVLAGEQGPSCTAIQQIPDLKVVHVRFIEPNDRDADHDTASMAADRMSERDRQLKRPCRQAVTQSLPVTKVHSPSKAFPKSLSVLEMMKLGKVINEKTTETIEMYTFELSDMAWSQPSMVEFSIAKEPFGRGGFREAFKASSKTVGFDDGQQWVVKKYLESAVNVIKETKQTLEQHTRKVVQMHLLARNFTKKLEQELRSNDNLELYGKTLTYKKIYMGRINGQTGDE